jgi:WD40 repeat protein
MRVQACRISARGVAACACLTALLGCNPPGAAGPGPEPARPSAPATASAATAAVAEPKPAVCQLAVKKLDYVAWSPDGRTLLTGGASDVKQPDGDESIEEGSIDAWDLTTGQRAFTFHVGRAEWPSRPVVVAWAPDGKSAISAGIADGLGQHVARWDLASGGTRFTRSGIAFPREAEVSRDGKRFAAVGDAGQVVSIDLGSLKESAVLPYDEGHAEGSIAFAKDDATLLHGIGERSLVIRDPRTLKPKQEIAGSTAIAPDRTAIAAIGERWSGVIDAVTGKRLRAFAGRPIKAREDADVALVRFSPDGKRVGFFRRSDARLFVWDAATGKAAGEAQLSADASAIVWTRDAKLVIAGKQVRDAETLKPVAELPAPPFAAFGKGHLVLVREKHMLIEHDASTGKATGRSWSLAGLGEGLVTSPDEAFFAYAPEGGSTIRVVRVADGASVDLGVVRAGKQQKGYVAAGDGGFDGPEEAVPCAPKAAGGARRAAPGLLAKLLGRAP